MAADVSTNVVLTRRSLDSRVVKGRAWHVDECGWRVTQSPWCMGAVWPPPWRVLARVDLLMRVLARGTTSLVGGSACGSLVARVRD